MLKCKPRLEIWPAGGRITCICGKLMNLFGDHCLSCTRHCKALLSNSIRDGLKPLLSSVFQLCRLTSNGSMFDKEPERIIQGLPNLQPFGISVLFRHVLGNSARCCPLSRLECDITVVRSTSQYSTDTKSAHK